MRSAAMAAGLLLALGAGAALPRPAWAEYPDHPVTVIHNYGPGTASDATARAMAEAFAAQFGVAFPVVNRDGAAGVVGARALAASAPDGYTLLIGPMTALTSQPWLVKDSGLSPDAVTPVCNLTTNMLGIVVRADSPWQDGAALVAAARRKVLSYGTTGELSLSALGVHKLRAAAGGQYQSVAYRSDGASLADVLGGRLDFAATMLANATPQLEAGQLRLLGVFADRRYPAFPDAPTFPEQGFAAEQMAYAGILAPTGTPAPIVTKLEAACAAAMTTAPWQRTVERFGIVVDHRDRAGFAALLQQEYTELGRVLRAMGAKPE
jgi:tripartite-type tricarboxylate transporter receptor subunit TctC